MKHLIKIIALLSALCLMLGMLSGCSGTEVDFPYYDEIVTDTEAELQNLENGVVAENEYFKMIWHKDMTDSYGTVYPRAAIEFVSKKDGTVWSTIPKEYYDTAAPEMLSANGLINSSLTILVADSDRQMEYNAYDYCISKNRFESKKMEGKEGISITYYFDEQAVILTVDYYLEGEGFKVSVDPKKVNSYYIALSDDGAYRNVNTKKIQHVINVNPAPFLCGAQNTVAGTKDSYMVIPSGSGALMYIDQRTDNTARRFEGMVYGDDYTVDRYDNPFNVTPVTMPFYGIKKGNSALCAIIEQGAESCTIAANAGDPSVGSDPFAIDLSYGYSNVSAKYSVLGYNNVYAAGSHRKQYSPRVEQNLTPLIIGYYPLSGADADYVGMAKTYQKHLVKNEGMKKSQENSLLNVKLYGVYEEDDLFVGIPTTTDRVLTSYNEATEILTELKEISGGSLTANMFGYGKGGIDSPSLAGGFVLDGPAGNEDELKSFLKFTKDNGIQTFFSFDTIVFSKSTNGYSISSDTAENTNGIPAPVYNYKYSNRARRTFSEGSTVGAMIRRDQLANVTNDVVALADEFGITGIAFDTLGNMAYSDYSEIEDDPEGINKQNPVRNNMGNDVKKIIADTQGKSKTVLTDGAFAYAAVATDIIGSAPVASNRNTSLDLDVPLYQIVFQGYKANYTNAINTATNQRTQFLKSIETGSGLSFNLIKNYFKDLRKLEERGIQACLYEDNLQTIKEYVNESRDFLAKVAGSTITDHAYVTSKVVKTTFDDGTIVYVNYGKTAYTVDGVSIPAEGFSTVNVK